MRHFLVLLTLVACGEKQGAPPCEAVGTKFVVLAKYDLANAKVDAETRRLVLDQLPAMRDSLVNACKDSEWAPAVRTCMVDASDHVTFESCEHALTSTQRNALERGDSDER